GQAWRQRTWWAGLLLVGALACSPEGRGGVSKQHREAKTILFTHGFGYVGPQRQPMTQADVRDRLGNGSDMPTFETLICNAYKRDGIISLPYLFGGHKDVRGTSGWVQQMVRALAKRGHDVIVMTPAAQTADCRFDGQTEFHPESEEASGSGSVRYLRVHLDAEAMARVDDSRIRGRPLVAGDGETVDRLPLWDKYKGLYRAPFIGAVGAKFLKSQGLNPDIIVANHIVGGVMAEAVVREKKGCASENTIVVNVPHSLHFQRNEVPAGVSPDDHAYRKFREEAYYSAASNIVVGSSGDQAVLGMLKSTPSTTLMQPFMGYDELIFNQDRTQARDRNEASVDIAFDADSWKKLGEIRPYFTMWGGTDERKGHGLLAQAYQVMPATVRSQTHAIAFGGQRGDAGYQALLARYADVLTDGAGHDGQAAELRPSPSQWRLGWYAKAALATVAPNINESVGFACYEAIASGLGICSTGMGASEPLFEQGVIYIGASDKPLFSGTQVPKNMDKNPPEIARVYGEKFLHIDPSAYEGDVSKVDVGALRQQSYILVNPTDIESFSFALQLVYWLQKNNNDAYKKLARKGVEGLEKIGLTWPRVSKEFDEILDGFLRQPLPAAG
ncbi:MAG: glycosyltransferase, partial [Polyangiales bacterium]